MSARQEIARDIYGFIADLEGYVRYAFPWGKKGTILEEFPHGPDKWQIDEFRQLAEHILLNVQKKNIGLEQDPYYSATASGHGIGKSAFVAWLILAFMSTRPGCRGVVTANTGDQLEDKTWPELAKWHKLAINADWFEWSATKFVCKLPDAQGKSQEENWRFDCITWNEERTESFAGLHNAGNTVVVIFDEASAIPDKIWEVAEGAMSDGEGFFFAFGNPTRNTGRFKQCFGKFRERFKTRHVDSREVRITNKGKLAQDIVLYGEDSDYTRIRIKGQFPRQSDKQFIATDVVEAAQARPMPEADPGAALIFGVDVARSLLSAGRGGKTVIRARQGRDARSIPPLKIRSRNLVDIADRLCEHINRHNPDAVNIDAGGLGAGLIDIMRSRRYKVNEIWFSSKSSSKEWFDKRTEMWGDLGDDLNAGLCIDADQELHDDLIAPEKVYTGKQGDVIKLESKEDMEKRGEPSPDDGDALALTYAVKIARRDVRAGRSGKVSVAEGVDSDPLSDG